MWESASLVRQGRGEAGKRKRPGRSNRPAQGLTAKPFPKRRTLRAWGVLLAALYTVLAVIATKKNSPGPRRHVATFRHVEARCGSWQEVIHGQTEPAAENGLHSARLHRSRRAGDRLDVRS